MTKLPQMKNNKNSNIFSHTSQRNVNKVLSRKEQIMLKLTESHPNNLLYKSNKLTYILDFLHKVIFSSLLFMFAIMFANTFKITGVFRRFQLDGHNCFNILIYMY